MAAWVSGNRYLSRSEMENNATLFYGIFNQYGATLNAISAMLGNMQSESGINPGIWESLNPYAGGYGLVQWTPYTKYSEWAGSGWQDNGPKECQRIIYEAENGLQWFENPSAPIVNPPMSFAQFLKSTESVDTLANYFLWFYEHPAVTIQPQRATQAREWYQFLSGVEPPDPPDPPHPPGPGPGPIRRTGKMPVWMMLRRGEFLW